MIERKPKEPVKIFLRGSQSAEARPVVINCLGDSITFGVGSSTTPEVPTENWVPYHKVWQNRYEASVYNYGQSGSFLADYIDRSKGSLPNPSHAFVKRCSQMDKSADIITVLGGVNDCQAGYYTPQEFGTLADSENKDVTTFCGALRVMSETLCQLYPQALIIYLTPLQYADRQDNLDAIWENSRQLPFYINAMKQIAGEYQIPVIDLYTPSELHFCTESNDPLFCGDRLHFGYKAHAVLADYIIQQLIHSGFITIQ